jgi:hypothetical protein
MGDTGIVVSCGASASGTGGTGRVGPLRRRDRGMEAPPVLHTLPHPLLQPLHTGDARGERGIRLLVRRRRPGFPGRPSRSALR